MKLYLILFLIISVNYALSAQGKDHQLPVVGRPCPELDFNDVYYYPKKKISLHDFKGKWVVLDVWSMWCGTCLASMPKVDALRKKYAEQVEFMMVGSTRADEYEQTLKIYERNRAAHNLNLPTSIDSTIYEKWQLNGLPYVVIVDPKGIVRAITSRVDERVIMNLLSGSDIPVPALIMGKNRVYTDDGKDKNSYLKDTSNYLSFSGFTNWNYKYARISSLDIFSGRNYLTMQGAGLKKLYWYAYYGHSYSRLQLESDTVILMYPSVILDVRDTVLFTPNYLTGENVYTYNLKVPQPLKGDSLMRIMQYDLRKTFGYHARIERRRMPCLYLVASEKGKEKLITKGGSPERFTVPFKFKLINKDVSDLVKMLSRKTGYTVIDRTEIKTKIDILIDGFILGERSDLVKGLSKNGLGLVEGEEEMDVLVVSDSEHESTSVN